MKFLVTLAVLLIAHFPGSLQYDDLKCDRELLQFETAYDNRELWALKRKQFRKSRCGKIFQCSF